MARRSLIFALLLGLALAAYAGAAFAAGGLGYSIGDAVIGRIPGGNSFVLYIGPMYGGGLEKTTFTIARNSSGDIVLSWTGSTPDIYYMTGDGTGKFSNAYPGGWTKVVPGSTSGFDPVSGTKLTHRASAAIAPEIYYKALPAGANPAAVSGTTTIFAVSPAVGKLDINLSKTTDPQTDPGKNYVSVPFEQSIDSINNVLDVNQFDAGTKVYSQLQGQHYNFDIAQVGTLSGAKAWVSGFNAAQSVGDTFMIVPEKGYMIEVPSNKTVTVVGGVLRETEGRARQMDANDYTYIGNFYPVQFPLANTDVNTTLKLTGTAVPKDGDSIYYQLKPGTKYNFDIATFKGGKWTSGFDKSGNTPTTMILGLPYGYMYQRNGAAFTWTR